MMPYFAVQAMRGPATSEASAPSALVSPPVDTSVAAPPDAPTNVSVTAAAPNNPGVSVSESLSFADEYYSNLDGIKVTGSGPVPAGALASFLGGNSGGIAQAPGAAYTVQVAAYNHGGDSPAASASYTSPNFPVPGVPSLSSAAGVSASEIDLTFAPLAQQQGIGYTAMISADGTNWFAESLNVNADGVSGRLTGDFVPSTLERVIHTRIVLNSAWLVLCLPRTSMSVFIPCAGDIVMRWRRMDRLAASWVSSSSFSSLRVPDSGMFSAGKIR